MPEPVKKCTGQPGISSPHDWVLQDKLNEKTTLKSGQIKHTHYLLCSSCGGQMIETMWELRGKLKNSKLQWKDPVKKAVS